MAFLKLEQENEAGYRDELHIKLPGFPFKFKGDRGFNYELGDFRGRGGNGTVFQCHLFGGRVMAVKFLHVLSARHRARFAFEHKVLKQLKHKGILRMDDWGCLKGLHTSDRLTAVDDIPYIVTDVFDGNLEDEVQKKGPLAPATVKSFALQICEAFRYVHSQKVIHRDIKPANFFLSNGTIIVGDFGLAKTQDDEGQTRFLRPKITGDDERVGPAEYMSPELIAYAADVTKTFPVDHRSDIFQIGSVIWFMLTGSLMRGVPEIDDDPSGGSFFPIVARCLRLKPDKRFQSVVDLATELAAI